MGTTHPESEKTRSEGGGKKPRFKKMRIHYGGGGSKLNTHEQKETEKAHKEPSPENINRSPAYSVKKEKKRGKEEKEEEGSFQV